MRLTAFVLALGLATALPASAQSTPPPPDPVLLKLPAATLAAFVAGDSAALRSHCTAGATVIDEFPPYTWSGADACAGWLAAFKAFALHVKLTKLKGAVVGTPFVDAAGARGYVTARVHFTADIDGKPLTDDGTWTMVVTRTSGEWKATHIAWGVWSEKP